MSEVINKHSRTPRKLSRRTMRRREQEAIGGVFSLNGVDAKAIVARYLAGEKIKDMAIEYQVSKMALYSHLLKFAPEEWMAAQRARAFAMKESGEEQLQDAQDPLELAKGREITRSGQWDLERTFRKEYGRDEQTVNINITDLGERLRRARERTIEAQTVQVIEHGNSSVPSIAVTHAHEADKQVA